MRRRRSLIVVLSLAGALAACARAQQPAHTAHHTPSDSGSAVEAFMRRAREGTERYRDQRVAVEDGYRRLGPDFPAMGEHWANAELVAKGELDPARPGLLTYARVNGVPTLTGAVYAIPLSDGARAPASPFDASHWHDHLGTVDEESMLLDHGARELPSGGMRLAVLHLWVWVDNPAGRSVTDNWALPFTRLGLATPTNAPIGAARALSLVSGAASYYAGLARTTAAPSAEEQRHIDVALGRCSDRVRGWWSSRAAGAALTAPELAMLEERWMAAWREIETAVSPSVARKLGPVWRP